MTDTKKREYIQFADKVVVTYRKRILTKDEVASILKVNLKTGEFDKEIQFLEDIQRVDLLMLLHSDKIIEEKILRKQVFGIDREDMVEWSVKE